ncbi:MAG TPA: hypothetical protein VIF33_07565, partial [Casimicrobiaceae bacterium]
LASGVFVSLLPVGLVGARVLVRSRARDAIALALPLSIALWSIPLAVTAASGHFSARWNGAFAWIATAMAIAILARHRSRAFLHDLRAAIAMESGALVVLTVAAIIYALAAAETLIGSRDEGLYTLAGLALGRSGSIQIATPNALARASGLFEPFVSGIPFYLPGIPDANVLRPQFAAMLPAWIAQLHAVGGDAVLYRINLLFAVAAGAVFHALARRVLRRSFALLALVLFALNPAQVWIARINLSEPLGALFALAGLLLALEFVRVGGTNRMWVTVVLLSLAALVRLDTIIVAPLLTATAVVSAVWFRDGVRSAALFRLGLCVLAGQSFAIALLALGSPAYVFEHLKFLLLAPAASAIGIVIYAMSSPRLLDAISDARARRVAATAVCAVLLVLFTYAWWVRPYVQPFAVIADRGSILAGMRDYREESLGNVAAYLGWPCLIMTLVGALLKIWRTIHGRGRSATSLIFVLAVGTGLVYLSAPRVSPDHPWAIRRMVTLVLPLFILVAGYGLQSALHAAIGWRRTRMPQIAAVALAAWMLVLQRATLDFSENAGVTAQLRALDAALPAGPLVMRDLEGLATTFALGFGRDVLPLRDERVTVDAASRAFWSSCGARGCTLLHANFEGLNGLDLSPLASMQLTREYLQPAIHPLAQDRAHETVHFFASRVTGMASDPAPTNAGSARDWRLEDRGFYRDELAPGMSVRWTDGDAHLTLPASNADRLEVRVASASPKPQPLVIELDGVPRFEGTLRPGEARWQFPIDNPNTRIHRLVLRSATFVPGASAGGRDRRSLGVSVRAIRMLDGKPPALEPQSPTRDFRSDLTVRRTSPDSIDDARAPAFRVDAGNLGAAAWTAMSEAAAGKPWVALGMYWTRPGDSRRIVEQRVELPYSLLPGEHWTTPIVAKLDAEPLRQLPPGSYELHVGLVFEGVAWFSDHGDRNVTIPITIPPPRS